MPFSLEIQNFGKLAHATIDIGNLTVFAGPNNTGKSHVSKLMYSLFDAMNANHALVHFASLSRPVRRRMQNLEFSAIGDVLGQDIRTMIIPSSPAAHFTGNIRKMANLIITRMSESTQGEDELLIFDGLRHELTQIADAMKESYSVLETDMMSSMSQYDLPPTKDSPRPEGSTVTKDEVLKFVEELKFAVSEFHEKILNTSSEKFIFAGVESQIHENLLHNYQIGTLDELKGFGEAPLSINISGIGIFQFGSDSIDFEIDRSGLIQMQNYSKVVYLESPLYWKLGPALENISPRFRHSTRINLEGVPAYFFDLMKALKSKFSGKMDFPDLFENLTKALGGKLILSETGELLFSEAGRAFSMHLTATGVANLGMLALLIERKVLDKGTFLFIDEPEAHLHPAWQVVMAETLFELARQGVNVVIATHSTDILKWIDVRTKLHPEDRQLIALNHFTTDGVKSDEEDFQVKLAGIKKSLTEPFMNLHLKGLGL